MRFFAVILSLFLCFPMHGRADDNSSRLALAKKFNGVNTLKEQLANYLWSFQKKSSNDIRNLMEPFILVQDDGVQVSEILKNLQEQLLQMNDISYKLVRDTHTQIILAIQEMALLKEAGWQIHSFSGMEGRWNTSPDLSGLIFYHAENNLIVVVYRGTAGNKDGWDTNFDATKTKARKIQKEFCRDLLDELSNYVRTSPDAVPLKPIKKIIRESQQNKNGYTNAKETFGKIKAAMEVHPIPEQAKTDILKACTTKMEIMDAVNQLGCNIVGQTHKGFLKKYLSTKREVLDTLKSIIKPMSYEQKRKLKIIFTGHSQAGGTGNLALADLCVNHGRELFGANFSNQKNHHFYGYFLSAARAGNKAYKKWVHEHVGQAFIIRQNVEGDPTPISSGDEKVGEYVNQIPVVGELLAKNMTQYDDTGYLLLDSGHKTWKRAKALYEEEGHDMDTFSETEDIVRYMASWVLQDESSIPKYLAPHKEDTSFFWSPIKWVKNRIRAAKIANLVRKALSGDKDATQELEALSETVLTRYAHLHYGHYYKDIGAVFSHSIVGRDLDDMVMRGLLHTQDKE